MAKIRKFRAGEEVSEISSASDSAEAKDKTAGLAASNAEKKSSGFLGLGRLFQGNIDEKGSEAYEQYGAGYGRKVEAENNAKKAETKRKPAEPAAPAPAPAAKETNYRSSGDYDDTADMKRKQGSAKATEATSAKPAAVTTFTKVDEDMPVVRPSGGAQVKAGDARPAEYANTFPSATSPEKSDGGARDTSSFKKSTSTGAAAAAARSAAAAKAAAAKAAADEANRTRRSDREEDRAVPKPAVVKKLSQDDLKAAADKARESGDSSGSKDPYADDISLDFAERRKRLAQRMQRRTNADRETEAKSANERIKDKFGFKKGGAIQSYAKGGSVSASSRGDGIAQRGKTRGRVC
jgi:hypothetical protein